MVRAYTRVVQPLKIRVFRDPAAGVWVAESEDVPGLVTEAEGLERLLEKLQAMIPELWSLNRTGPRPPVRVKIEAELSLS